MSNIAIVEDASRRIQHLERDVATLKHALTFYAEERRYEGPNCRTLIHGDLHQPSDSAYRWDVTRDGGKIARDALRRVVVDNR